MTASLSLMMIVRDEEATLARVLEQAAVVCDELVVVDTGSIDATPEVARAFGATVTFFPWVDDFAAARNAALEACHGDWLIWLDADDVLTPQSQAAILAAKEALLDDQLDGVMAPYRYQFSPAGDECLLSHPRERLARSQPGLRWTGAIHETLTIPGGRLAYRDDIYVEHRPDPSRQAGKEGRNLRILEAQRELGDTSPRTMYYLGSELRSAGRLPEALDAYEAYLLDHGLAWEHHAALVNMAAVCRDLGEEGRATGLLLRAVDVDPARVEAFLMLGWPHFGNGEWARALPFYAAAAAARAPSDGFVSPGDYTWRPLDFLGVCLANLGRHDEAVPAIEQALALGHPDTDRLEANLAWSRSERARLRPPVDVAPTALPKIMLPGPAALTLR